MDVSRPVLAGAAVLLGLVLGPWLSRTAGRLAARGAPAPVAPLRDVVVTALTAGLLCAAALVGGLRPVTAGLLCAAALVGGIRPVTAGLLWVGGAVVVLGAVDLAVHRLPDRVLVPAAGVFALAVLVDAVVLDTWWALARAALAAGAAFAVAAGAAAVSPSALGFGDVKLMGLLGLVLGWFGWGVLLAGIFLGLLVGAAGSVLLVLTGRATWSSTVPFGPPLLIGAVLALAIGADPPG